MEELEFRLLREGAKAVENILQNWTDGREQTSGRRF